MGCSDQRKTHRPADRLADADRAAAGVVSVIAVRQHHHRGDDDDVDERPEHVVGAQERSEVMLVGAGRLSVQERRDDLRREERQDQADRVERDDHHQPGQHPGRHQVRVGLDAHHFERVDLLADPHGAELGRGAGADRGRQRDAGDDGGDEAHVDECGDEPEQGLESDVAQRREALDGDQRTGRERHETDDHRGAADHGHGAGAHADLGDQSQDLLAVAGQRPRHVADTDDREPAELSGFVERFGRGVTEATKVAGQPREAGAQYLGGRHVSAPFRIAHRWWSAPR